jgi:hypothetical protein
VIGLFIGKMLATRFADVSAGLNVPLGHEIGQNGRVFWDRIARMRAESQ